MPRRQRFHVPGGTYYVVRRTHLPRPVFARPEDYTLFESLLPAALRRTGAQLLGYCWMPDAIHLALQIDSVPVGDFMRELASRYARQVQVRTGERGQFFRRPYQSTLIDPDTYLLTLIQYLHNIPTIEGVARQAGDYPYSSHGAYFGRTHRSWLNTRPLLQLVGSNEENRIAHCRLIGDIPPRCAREMLERGQTNSPGVLGDAEFLAALPRKGRAARSARSLDDIAEHVARVHGLHRGLLLSRSRRQELVLARAQMAWYATERRVATLCHVARYLGRSASSLTRAIARHQRRRPDLFTFDAFASFIPIVPLTSPSHFGRRYPTSGSRTPRDADIPHGDSRREPASGRSQAWQ